MLHGRSITKETGQEEMTEEDTFNKLRRIDIKDAIELVYAWKKTEMSDQDIMSILSKAGWTIDEYEKEWPLYYHRKDYDN